MQIENVSAEDIVVTVARAFIEPSGGDVVMRGRKHHLASAVVAGRLVDGLEKTPGGAAPSSAGRNKEVMKDPRGREPERVVREVAQSKSGHATGFIEGAESGRVIGRQPTGQEFPLPIRSLWDAVKVQIGGEKRGQLVKVGPREASGHGWAGMGSISPLARRVW